MIQRKPLEMVTETVSQKAIWEGVAEIQQTDAGDSQRRRAFANPHPAKLLQQARPPALRWRRNVAEQSA